MPWTDAARRQYARPAARHATDLTDAEHALLAPHLPAPERLGRPREVDLREVLNAILYLLPLPAARRLPLAAAAQGVPAQGHGLRLLSALLGGRDVAGDPRHAGHGGARAGRPGGVADGRHHRQPERQDHRGRRAAWLRRGQESSRAQAACRGRHAGPAPGPGRPRRRCPRPRRDGLALVCRRLRRRFPWLAVLFADGGYRGEIAARAAAQERLRLAIVKRDAGVRGFAVLPRRWVVERTFAWFGRNRRLAKDFERHVASAAALFYLASLQLLTRRLARA
jgi:transposase